MNKQLCAVPVPSKVICQNMNIGREGKGDMEMKVKRKESQGNTSASPIHSNMIQHDYRERDNKVKQSVDSRDANYRLIH